MSKEAPSQMARVRKLMWDHAMTLKMSDTITAIDAIGPTLVIAGTPPQPNYGWSLAMSLKHNRLIGQVDIVVTVPVVGVLPVDEIFVQATQMLLEECRKERDKMNALPPEPMPGGADIPAGLRGKRLDLPT